MICYFNSSLRFALTAIRAVSEEETQFMFHFLHKIVNKGLEGEGVIKQDSKVFVHMNHIYDISLKSGHCGD